MKNIKLGFWFFVAALSGLWLLADTFVPPTVNFFSLRGVFIQYTGVLGMGVMSVAMLLAVRPKWLESRLNGLVMALLMAGGTVAALMALFGRIGARRKVQGRIEALTYYPELRVLETAIQLQKGWSGHAAGQFAFVTSDRRESAHPYTLASAWKDDGRIVFITKALGDHTSRLRERLKIGDPVTVEGPYGCFTFADQRARQIWVGGGIGITLLWPA